MSTFNGLRNHFPNHRDFLCDPQPFKTMFVIDPTGRKVVDLFEHVLNIENWNQDNLLHYLAAKSYRSLKNAKVLGKKERKDFKRLKKIFKNVSPQVNPPSEDHMEKERVKAFMSFRQPAPYYFQYQQTNKKEETQDSACDASQVEENNSEVKPEEKDELDEIPSEVREIVNNILIHTKRDKDDHVFQENKKQLVVLVDYYLKDKDDAHEPRAREMLKDMFSIPRKQYPTDEEFAKIKKLKSKMGRLIHPDKFSSATLELRTIIQEIFQFLDSCLGNSGYTRR